MCIAGPKTQLAGAIPATPAPSMQAADNLSLGGAEGIPRGASAIGRLSLRTGAAGTGSVAQSSAATQSSTARTSSAAAAPVAPASAAPPAAPPSLALSVPAGTPSGLISPLNTPQAYSRYSGLAFSPNSGLRIATA